MAFNFRPVHTSKGDTPVKILFGYIQFAIECYSENLTSLVVKPNVSYGVNTVVTKGHLISKYFFLFLLSVLTAVGLSVLSLGIVSGKSGAFFFGVVFSTISISIMVLGLKAINIRLAQLEKFSTHTFDSYKNKHPNLVKHDSVECFSCGGKRISARALLNKTYHREHFCTKCGTTLYYSPEQNI